MILKGVKPVELPVIRPFSQLIMKPQDRQALGVTIPAAVLLRAKHDRPASRLEIAAHSCPLPAPYHAASVLDLRADGRVAPL